MTKVLSVVVTALTQSIRSLLLTLIPSSIITFLSWAIAGSAYASTTDPFRAGAWVTLGAHAVPFNLQIPPSGVAGWFTYLPLGAMFLPAIGIGSGARRTSESTNQTGAVALFIFFYVALLTLLGITSSNSDVTAKWYWILAFATPFVILVSYLSLTKFKFSHALVYLAKIWALLLGSAALLLGISLILNLKTVKQLTLILQPGIIGGALLLFLNLLYLPNFMISALSYFVGTGYAIGRDTLISPFTFQLGKIPALPILGALPTGKHPLYVLFALLVVAIGAQVAYWTLNSGRLLLKQVCALFVGSTFLFAYLGSGALITYQLGTIGPSLWKFPLALSAEFLLGVGLMRLIPLIGRR